MNNNPTELEVFIHDIASPLTNIGISLENMKSQIHSNPSQLEKTIVATIDSLEYLFSITKQNIPINNQQHQPDYLLLGLIQEIITNKFKFILDQNNILLMNDIREEILISYDRFLLNRVFTNIISNSIDALVAKSAFTNKKIKLTASESQGHLIISIIDNGIGIDSQSQINIFNYGYSGKDSHKGIGLPFCKDIIENHFNGTLDIKSLLGIGTVVKIYLPI